MILNTRLYVLIFLYCLCIIVGLHLKSGIPRDKISELHGKINRLNNKGMQDWPIEYSYIDPPDRQLAEMAKDLIDDFKPFLKDAKSIKERDLDEGKKNLQIMEDLRWDVHNKLEKAKITPLLPDIYRFIE